MNGTDDLVMGEQGVDELLKAGGGVGVGMGEVEETAVFVAAKVMIRDWHKCQLYSVGVEKGTAVLPHYLNQIHVAQTIDHLLRQATRN